MRVRPWKRVDWRIGAESYFRRLYPLLAERRIVKLAELAVEYWQRPERYK